MLYWISLNSFAVFIAVCSSEEAEQPVKRTKNKNMNSVFFNLVTPRYKFLPSLIDIDYNLKSATVLLLMLDP